jgi:hypothetical protein
MVPRPGVGIEPRTPQNLMCVTVLMKSSYPSIAEKQATGMFGLPRRA